MKRFLLLFLSLISASLIYGQARYWVGLTGGVWSSTANWSVASGGAPGASSPVTANDVIFDNGFNGVVEMDVLSTTTFTINSLLITANSTVTLQRTQTGGGTRVFELASISTVTPGLKIDNGSTLIIDAVNAGGTLDYTLALTGGAGVTGDIAGNLFIRGTGAGIGGAEIDLFDDATHFADLKIKNLGLIRYEDDSDNTSPATGSYITMENGSVYELNKNGGSFPPGVWQPTSLARATGTGANPPSFNGTSYGNMEWNCPLQTAVAFLNADISFNNVNFISTNNTAFRVKTGATPGTYTMTINGSLTVSNTSFVELTGNTTTAGNGGRINLKGDFNNQGTFTTNGVTNTVNEFEINGSAPQTLINTGTFSGNLLLVIMNNSSGVTLSSPLTLPYNLALTNGKITTTATNLLTMIDGATYSGGSAASFISGPMKKIGNDNFSFPVGKGSIYAPVGMVNVSGEVISDEFTAEYIRTNPQSIHGSATQTGNDHVSFVEYWTLNQGVGAATKKVSLTVNTTSFCKVLANTFVSRWGGAFWTNEGSTNGGVTSIPPFETGVITSTANLSSFGDITLITDLPFSINPLPIDLITFNASKNNSTAALTWELSACCSKDARFELQKSADGRQFNTMISVQGSETNKLYSLTDNRLHKGINYYRLKMIDADGKISYSKTVAVIHERNDILITSIAPNPVQDNAVITVSAAQQGLVSFTVYDMAGRQIKRWQAAIASGNTSVTMNAAGLPKGMYQVLAAAAGAKTVFRFVKQ